MAGLKELRNRLGSIKSTQKITSAMKLVAASRLRRAQILLEKNRNYADKLEQSVRRLTVALNEEARRRNIVFFPPALVAQKTNIKTCLLLVLSSDRGLCGSYNHHVGKTALRRIAELEESGIRVRIICFGKKAYDILKRKYADRIEEHHPALGGKGLSYQEASDLTQRICTLCQNGTFDVCEAVYSQFRSAVSRDIRSHRIYPLESVCFDQPQDEKDLLRIGNAFYDFKPNPQTLLDFLLPQLMIETLFSAMINSQASEQGARMAAMDNATRNAKEMISTLTLKYNSIRQSAITTELTEIISGAEAI